MKKIEAIVRTFKRNDVIEAINGVKRGRMMTVYEVAGMDGVYSPTSAHTYDPSPVFDARILIVLVVQESEVSAVVQAIIQAAQTHRFRDEDGMVYVTDIVGAYRIRTGESGEESL